VLPKIGAGLAIAAVASVAGVISYGHIYELTLALHQSVLTARLMPVAIDGLVTVGSVVLLQSGSRIGWLGVGPGLALSVFANVESGIRFGWLAAVWAGIPALSFFLATFILERWLKSQAQVAAAIPSADEAAETVASVAADVPEAVPDIEPVGTVPPVPASVPRTVASVRAPGRAPVGKAKSPERVFAAEISRGELPSLRAVKAGMRVGTDRAREIQSEVRALLEVNAA
jgi:hypothetical protein